MSYRHRINRVTSPATEAPPRASHHLCALRARVSVALVAVLVFALGPAGSPGRAADAAGAPDQVTIAVSPEPLSALIYVAQAKRFFEQEGLHVTLRPHATGRDALAAVAGGKAEFGTAADTPIVMAAFKREGLSIIATIANSDRYMVIIARKERGISGSADLKGKRIGLIAGTTAEFFVHVYLTAAHIAPQEVKVVDLAPGQVVAALVNGEVDAVSTRPPDASVLRERLGTDAVLLTDPSLYTITWNVVASQDSIRDHPERVRKLLRALVQADKFAAEKPGEARAITSEGMGMRRPLPERDWSDCHFGVALDQSLILNLEDQARWMLEQPAGKGHSMPNFLDLISTDGLKAVQPEAVRIPGK